MKSKTAGITDEMIADQFRWYGADRIILFGSLARGEPAADIDFDKVCFIAQQAAEKATKACLYSAGQRYPNGLPGGTPFETYSARDLEQAVTDMEAIFAAAERFLRGRGILE